MAKPFSALPGILSRRERQFRRGVERIAREAAQAAGSAAVRSTPVDEGTARSNWRATIVAPAEGVIPAYAPGSKLGLAEVGNAAGAEGQQATVIRGWDANRGTLLYIANNVEYIGPLNFGGPKNAPSNMLAKASQAWVVSIKTPRRILV